MLHLSPVVTKTLRLLRVLVKLGHGLLVLVVATVQRPEHTAGNSTRHAQPSVHPQQLRIDGGGRERNRQRGAKCVGQQEHGHDERLHGAGGARVGVLEAGDGGEDFGKADEQVGWGLHRHVHVVGGVGAVCLQRGGAGGGGLVAGAGAVDEFLDAGRVGHCEGAEEEAPGDARDGLELDADLAQGRVEELVADGDEDDDGDGVDVLHNVVWDAVQLHLPGLRDEIVEHLRVDDPVDGVEGEDLAGDEGALDFLDEQAVPLEVVIAVAELCLVFGLCGVEVALVCDTDPDDLECLGDDGTLWRLDYVFVLAEKQCSETNQEEEEGQKVGCPETNILLEFGGCDTGKGSNVNHEVKDHVNPLNSGRRIDNDSLSALHRLDVGSRVLVLFGNQGRNIGFDSSSSKTNNNHGSDKTTQSSSILNGNGQGGQEQDHCADNIDDGEVKDGPVLSKVLIRYNGSNNGGHIAPKLKEVLNSPTMSMEVR